MEPIITGVVILIGIASVVIALYCADMAMALKRIADALERRKQVSASEDSRDATT